MLLPGLSPCSSRTDAPEWGKRENYHDRYAEEETNLVEDGLFDRGFGKSDGLLEVIADLDELLALGPVVERASYVHLLSRVRPASSIPGQQSCSTVTT